MALAVAACFAWWVWRQGKRDQEAVDARAAGVLALERGDFQGAIAGLSAYLKRFQKSGVLTAQDYILFARARRRVELPRDAHIGNAIEILRLALSIDGRNAEARDELLDIYYDAGYATESLDLIELMLETQPANVRLLKMKRDLLTETRQFQKSLQAAIRVNECAPDDLLAFIHTLSLMHETHATRQEIDAWVDGVVAAHAADPRFELLRAAALSRRRDESRAREALDHVLVTTSEVTDPDFVTALVGELDVAGRFADSLKVLETRLSAERPALRRELVRRLWFTRRAGEVVAHSDRWGEESVRADPEMMALRALALDVVGRSPDAEALAGALRDRRDPEGRAWSVLLEHSRPDRTTGARDAAAALGEAVKSVPDSAFHWQSLGDAYSGLGETDLAFDALGKASRAAPAWGRPLRSAADLLIKRGQPHLATSAAREAVRRDPTDGDSIGTFVRAHAVMAGKLPEDVVNDLLSHFTPPDDGVVDESLPVYIELLARVDKSAAEERLARVLTSQAGTSEGTLLKLAHVASRLNMALCGRLLDLSQSIHGITPQLALAKAMWRARSSGDDAIGLTVLDDLRSRAGGGTDDLGWNLVRASYLEALRRPDAGAAWVELAKKYPDELNAQLGALASSAAWEDRAAMSEVIERVRSLTGDQGVTWRVARARWLIDGPDAAESDIAEAAKILGEVSRGAPSSTSARVLLARAFEKLGNLPGAEEQLRLAADLAPENSSITLEVARLALKQGHPEEARRQLDRLPPVQELAPEQVERAAYLLAVQGDVRRGADLLEPLTTKFGSRREGTLLLVQLYLKLGELEKAAERCKERLEEDPDLQFVELAASIDAARGKTADAEAKLTRLDALPLRSGDRELARARFAARWGTPDAARTWFRSAVARAPDRAEIWTEFLSFCVGTGDRAGLDAILDDANSGGAEPVRFLRGVRELCGVAIKDVRLRVLLLASLTEVENRPVLTEALRRVATADGSDREKRAESAQSIRALADANPRVLSLQLLAADLCAESGDLKGGCAIARRAMQEFPNSAAAARLASELLARAGRWPETLETSLAWRDRAGRLDLLPELYVAEALLRTDRAGEAAAGLEPHAAAALARPQENEPLLMAYALALVRSGRTQRAGELLSRLAAASGRWRSMPLGVGPSRLGSPAAAIDWLSICAANVPAEDDQGRLMLARAWASAWERLGKTPELMAGAQKILEELKKRPAVAADAYLMAATLNQQAGDLSAAKAEYVATLERNPANAAAHNNLACLLASTGEAAEAVRHAAKALEIVPNQPEYLDTLAISRRAGRDHDGSEAASREALRVEPGNPKYWLTLAETMAEAGKPDEVRKVLTRVDEIESRSVPLPSELRGRVDRLRAGLR